MNKKYYILFSSCLFLFSCSDEGINPVYGCLNENSPNYCEECNVDDGSCVDCFDNPIDTIDIDECIYTYTYDEDIYPIFDDNGCLACHYAGTSFGGLDLSTYIGTIAGGNHGEIISNLSPSTSLLITTFNPEGLMCLNQGICILPNQSMIEIWISEGAPE